MYYRILQSIKIPYITFVTITKVICISELPAGTYFKSKVRQIHLNAFIENVLSPQTNVIQRNYRFQN